MKKFIKTTGKVLLWIILSLFSLLIVLILLIRLEPVQNFLSHKATAFVSSKTHTKVAIHRIYIGLPKTFVLEGLFAEDLKKDTLIYLDKLAIDINLLSLIHKKIEVNELLLADLNSHISRSMPDSVFNFGFFINALEGTPDKSKMESKNDTISSSWSVSVRNIILKNIHATYVDEVSGNDMLVSLGDFNVNMKLTDIKNMHFDADVLSIANADVQIIQSGTANTKPVDTSLTMLPGLSLNKLNLSQFSFYYKNKTGGQSFKCSGNELQVSPEKIDLNAQKIVTKKLLLDRVYAEVGIKSDSIPVKVITLNKDFKTPDKGWDIKAGEILFKEVAFKFEVINKPKAVYGMDFNHLSFSSINFDIKNASYNPDKITAVINNVSLKEQCGLDLIKLKGNAVYDDKHAELSNLILVTSKSYISNYLKASYPSIQSLNRNIGSLGLNAVMHHTRIAYNDILLFAPQLKDQPYFASKKGMIIKVDGKIKGELKDVFINDLNVSDERGTSIVFGGHITGLPDAKNAVYDIKINSLTTNKSDLLTWIPQKSLPVTLPQNIHLRGNVKGTINNFLSEIAFESEVGNLNLKAQMKMGLIDTAYQMELHTHELNLGYLLNKPELLGAINFTSTVKGSGLSLQHLKADVVAEIQSVRLHNYNYKNIAVSVDAANGKFAVAILVDDSNIRLNMEGGMSLVDKQESIQLDIILEGANLTAMRLTNENIRASGKLNVNLEGKSLDDLSGRVNLNSVIVIKNDKKYRVDSFLVATVNDPKHSSLKMKSGFVNIDYDGSVTLAHLRKAVTKHIDRYFNIKDTLLGTDTSDQDFKLTVMIKPNPLINEVLLPKLERFNGAGITANFSNRKQQMDLVVNAPVIQYNGSKIIALDLSIHSDKNNLRYALGFDGFKSGSINLPFTSLKGRLQNNIIDFALAVVHKDSGDKLFIAGNINEVEAEEKYVLHLDQNLVFNNRKWELPKDNFISFKDKGIFMHEITLTDHKQMITIRSEGGNETAPLKVIFKDFELGTLSQIIEKDTAIIRGLLNGTFELRNLQKSPAFVSDLKISNIIYMQNPVGNLDIQANNNSAGQQGRYDAHITLSGQDNKMDIKGSYYVSENKKLDFKIDIGKLNLKSIEGFTGGQLRQSSGYLTGSMQLTGSGTNPIINGDIGIKNAGFNVAYINNYLKVIDDHIKIDPKGIYFKSFTVFDATGKQASIDGAVYTNDFKKMKFDLTIKTNNFMLMNTTIRDNGLYFGTIILSSNIKVKGDESLPVVNAQATLLAGTHVVVIVPSSQLNTDKGTGVVVMIDTSTHNHIMGHLDTTTVTKIFKGIDLIANVQIDKQTSFKVIVDRVSGDSLVVKGEGLLSFGIDASGKQSLTGTYMLNSGSYHASFQKVVKRDFKISSGSSITWSGSPLDATLDITAVYRTRTSPADLLATELTGTVASEQNAYHKPMYFNVNMMMKGPMMKPEVSFMLDMDERDKEAFGGIVYSKIGSLNNDQAELNKQVFSLLVLNKFVPSGSSSNTGEASAVNTIARNSVNQVLSDQLNQISGKYLKDVELNFDIQSNDQYSGTGVQQNTEVQVGLKKQFMNSRMSVQVGSNINVQDNGATTTNASNLTGDVIVEYKITEDGRYRFKAFRENQYAGIIDGLLYKTGVGVVYTRDFDNLKELRSAPKNEVDPK